MITTDKTTYLGNPNVKRDGVDTEWDKDLIKEYQKCMKNPAYFAGTYCKVINLDKGLVPFNLYPYQEKMFKSFDENRFNIVLACRQSGKSISSVAYLLWYALFHTEKTIAILANKGATAREMLARVTLMLENLPFFLQPGTKALNKGSIEFSNNSRILAAATSGSSIRGLSVSLLYLDEFAFVEKASEFYTSTYPVISSGTSTKVIITSTANGIGNMYYNLWQGAEQGVNDYKPFRVDWWDVPGRDDHWKLQTIANTSQLQFEQEFGNTFFGTGDTLINAETLMKLRAKQPYKIAEAGDFLVYEEPDKKKDYIMCVDVARGRGQDYSTFTLIDISSRPFKQVAVYRCNTISPILFPTIIYKYAVLYNNAYVVIESNDVGQVVCNGLYHDFEYENMHVSSANNLERGDEETVLAISTFIAKGQSYEASEGNHDDIMMNLVMFGYFATTAMFRDLTDIDIKQMLYDQRIAEIENDIPSFGFIDDGSDEIARIQREEDNSPWQIEYQQEF